MPKRKRGKGARARKQGIAPGLSKARHAEVSVRKKSAAKRATAGRKQSTRKAPVKRVRGSLARRRR